MSWFDRYSMTPIGIDVGYEHIKMVQLSGGPKRWRVEAAASVARRQPGVALEDQDIARLVDVLERMGFVGQRIVLAAPGHKVLSGVLELPPPAAGIPQQQIARMEMARTHRRDPHQFEMTYWDMPMHGPGQQTQVYAVACLHDDANLYLDLFEHHGLAVAAMDVHAAAIMRACKPLVLSDNSITAMLDVGWTSARLVLTHQNHVIFERHFEEGGMEPIHRLLISRLALDAQVIQQVMRCSAQPDADIPGGMMETITDLRGLLRGQFQALAQELQVSCAYVAQQVEDAQIDQLLVLGGGAMLPGIAAHLSQTLTIPARVARCGDLAQVPEAFRAICDDGSLTAALGLAQWHA